MRSILVGLGLALTVLLPTVAMAATESSPSTAPVDLNALILTPPPPATPRINGPSVFGVRPGNPVLYIIPATGNRPMVFTATGLPEGIALDASSGRITGSLAKAGTYSVTFHAKNDLGTVDRTFRIIVGEEITLTPPMASFFYGESNNPLYLATCWPEAPQSPRPTRRKGLSSRFREPRPIRTFPSSQLNLLIRYELTKRPLLRSKQAQWARPLIRVERHRQSDTGVTMDAASN